MLNHTGPINTCRDCNLRYNVQRLSVNLGLADLSFDLSVWDIFGILGAGALLVVPEASAGRYLYVPLCTSMYLYVPLCTSMYLYVHYSTL